MFKGNTLALAAWSRRRVIGVCSLLAAGAFACFTATGQDRPPVGREPSREAARQKSGDAPGAGAGEEPAIRASAAAFISAFNANDAQQVAALWTPAGTLTDENGELHKGREAIAAQYAKLFKDHPHARIVLRIRSIHFPSPEMAEEEGVAQVIAPGSQAAAASQYVAVHIRHEGNWQMASVRESRVELPSNAGRLADLAWLVGDWKAARRDTTVILSFRWIANQSFLQQTSTVTQDGIATSSGTHIIGWDPEAGRLRSWAFDATGGFGTGLWTTTEDGYRIESRGMLPDGTLTSSHDFLLRGEDHVLGWRSIDRYVGDERLPDMAEVVLDRIVNPPADATPAKPQDGVTKNVTKETSETSEK